MITLDGKKISRDRVIRILAMVGFPSPADFLQVIRGCYQLYLPCDIRATLEIR